MRSKIGKPNMLLRDCPDSPNCVCTFAHREYQRMQPLLCLAPQKAIEYVEEELVKLPRVKVVSRTADYLHLTFRSLIFQFVDDVEFQIDLGSNLLHFRSASRWGYSDLGVNRRRMQQITELLLALEEFELPPDDVEEQD